MHSALDPHLHTEECNQVIQALKECQTQTSKFRQLFGICNDLDMAMRRCTKKERIANTKANREKAEAENAERKKRLAKMDKEGLGWRDAIRERRQKVEEELNKQQQQQQQKQQ